MNENFFEIKTLAGRPESIGILNKLKGPFIITSQHNEVSSSWGKATQAYSLTDTFKLSWGMKAYQEGENNASELCGYWYDTSD